jgi:putative membrane protein
LVIVALLLIGGTRSADRTSELIRLGVVVLIVLLGFVSWAVTRWRVAEGALQIETGLIRRQSLRFPFTQIQAVDIVSPGLARIFGLSELRIRMASGSRSTGRLAYLPDAQAHAVRASLLDLTRSWTNAGIPGTAATAPAPAPDRPAPDPSTHAATDPAAAHPGPAYPGPGHPGPGYPPVDPGAFRPLYTVDQGRLIASIMLSGPALAVYLIVAGLATLATVAPGAAGGAIAGSISTLLAFGSAIWNRFNGQYRLSLGTGPHGLQMQTGLVQTSAETIPWGRIQALRTVQPVLWRPFGWYRVEVDVAGKNVSGRENRAAKRAGRALIPVGRAPEVEWLVNLLMPDAPTELSRPPTRARLKSPLRYRHLSYAGNDRYAVTTSGRLRIVTDRVPLEKVQSIRWRQGPVQRRLGLASLHFDKAGRSVYAVARDRDRSEAERLLATLPDLCRRARG